MMQHYKDAENNVYAFKTDENPQDWTDVKLIKITDAEAEQIRYEKYAPTKEQIIKQAESEKRYRLSQATNAIAPLQYAVDLQMETKAEQAFLLAWKKYCVLLNRVDCSKAPDIDWPKAPE